MKAKVFALIAIVIFLLMGCSLIKFLAVEPTVFQFKLFDLKDENGQPRYVTLPIEAKELAENPALEVYFMPVSYTLGIIQWRGVAVPERIYTLFVSNLEIDWFGFAIYNIKTEVIQSWIFDKKKMPELVTNEELNQHLQAIDRKLSSTEVDGFNFPGRIIAI